MTRGEEIINAGIDYTLSIRPNVICGDAFADDAKELNRNKYFEAGAIWSDQHPHWISVEDYSKDKLPPLIDKNDPYGESVQTLFVVILDGVQYINKGTFDYDTGVWHSLDMQCSFCKENVTHWMHLPKMPVLSNLENTGKDEKGGEV